MTGGLAAALLPVVEKSGAIWVGSSGRVRDGAFKDSFAEIQSPRHRRSFSAWTDAGASSSGRSVAKGQRREMPDGGKCQTAENA
jgi:hypothetical protein